MGTVAAAHYCVYRGGARSLYFPFFPQSSSERHGTKKIAFVLYEELHNEPFGQQGQDKRSVDRSADSYQTNAGPRGAQTGCSLLRRRDQQAHEARVEQSRVQHAMFRLAGTDSLHRYAESIEAHVGCRLACGTSGCPLGLA